MTRSGSGILQRTMLLTSVYSSSS